MEDWNDITKQREEKPEGKSKEHGGVENIFYSHIFYFLNFISPPRPKERNQVNNQRENEIIIAAAIVAENWGNIWMNKPISEVKSVVSIEKNRL